MLLTLLLLAGCTGPGEGGDGVPTQVGMDGTQLVLQVIPGEGIREDAENRTLVVACGVRSVITLSVSHGGGLPPIRPDVGLYFRNAAALVELEMPRQVDLGGPARSWEETYGFALPESFDGQQVQIVPFTSASKLDVVANALSAQARC